MISRYDKNHNNLIRIDRYCKRYSLVYSRVGRVKTLLVLIVLIPLTMGVVFLIGYAVEDKNHIKW